MKGGERDCPRCIHGPAQRACDVYQQARETFAQMPYGGMYCGCMERESVAARIGSTARRWASEALDFEGRR